MIRIHPDPRWEYAEAYRKLRMYGGVLDRENQYAPEDEYEEMAILSYDERDSNFSGWINHQRLAQFFDLKIRRFAGFWIPFR